MGPTEIGLAALIAVPFVTRFVGKIGESLAGNTLEQVKKLWQLIQGKPAGILPTLKSAATEASNVDIYQAAQELETVANEDSEVRQAIIDLFEAAKQENPESVIKNLESEFEKIKTQRPTVENYGKLAETIKNIFQGNNTFHGDQGGIHF